MNDATRKRRKAGAMETRALRLMREPKWSAQKKKYGLINSKVLIEAVVCLSFVFLVLPTPVVVEATTTTPSLATTVTAFPSTTTLQSSEEATDSINTMSISQRSVEEEEEEGTSVADFSSGDLLAQKNHENGDFSAGVSIASDSDTGGMSSDDSETEEEEEEEEENDNEKTQEESAEAELLVEGNSAFSAGDLADKQVNDEEGSENTAMTNEKSILEASSEASASSSGKMRTVSRISTPPDTVASSERISVASESAPAALNSQRTNSSFSSASGTSSQPMRTLKKLRAMLEDTDYATASLSSSVVATDTRPAEPSPVSISSQSSLSSAPLEYETTPIVGSDGEVSDSAADDDDLVVGDDVAVQAVVVNNNGEEDGTTIEIQETNVFLEEEEARTAAQNDLRTKSYHEGDDDIQGNDDIAAPQRLWTSQDRGKYRRRRKEDERRKRIKEEEEHQKQEQLRQRQRLQQHSDDEGTEDTDDGLGYTLPNLPIYLSDAEGSDPEETDEPATPIPQTPPNNQKREDSRKRQETIGGNTKAEVIQRGWAVQPQRTPQQQQQKNTHHQSMPPNSPYQYQGMPPPPPPFYGYNDAAAAAAAFAARQRQPPPPPPYAYGPYSVPQFQSSQQQQRQTGTSNGNVDAQYAAGYAAAWASAMGRYPYGPPPPYAPYYGPQAQQYRPSQQQQSRASVENAPAATNGTPAAYNAPPQQQQQQGFRVPDAFVRPPVSSTPSSGASRITSMQSGQAFSEEQSTSTSFEPYSGTTTMPSNQEIVPSVVEKDVLEPKGAISLAEAGTMITFDSMQKLSIVAIGIMLLSYCAVSPRNLPNVEYNAGFQENLRVVSLVAIGPLLFFLGVYDARENDLNAAVSTFYTSFTVGYALSFVMEVILTTVLRLAVFMIWEPAIFDLTPEVPTIALPWVLREKKYRPTRMTLFAADFATSCVAGPIVEEYIKLLVVRWSVRLPRNFRASKKNGKRQAKKKKRGSKTRTREPIPRNPGEPEVVNINSYVTQMFASSLGLKICDSARRILMYTKKEDANKAFYAACRGLFPIHELCGTMTALQLAKRDVLGVNMPLWQMLFPAVFIHGMANFRGKKPIFKWNSSTPWSEMQLSPWNVADDSTLGQILSKGFAKFMWVIILTRVLGYCVKNYYKIGRQAVKRTTTYAGKHAAFSAELAADEVLKKTKG